jgi:hypothetical protein
MKDYVQIRIERRTYERLAPKPLRVRGSVQ